MTQLPTWRDDPHPPYRADPPVAGPTFADPPVGDPQVGRQAASPPAPRPAAESGGPAGPASGLTAGQPGAPGIVIGGRYTMRTAIGHGGMGTVWRASDTLLRREVAVKEVLLPQGMAPADRDAMYQRTLREARAAAALSHPAVVQVYDVVTDGGRPWIVMELLQARSLAEMIVEDGPVAARAVAKIGVALLGALEVAHAAGVLHRDVKPANVLICSDGRCVLTDFGVARMPTDAELTTPGMVLGSPHFISPERAVGAKFGPPSDLFSLGVTLYTAVEGHPPFDKSDPFETMRAVVEDPPAPAMRAGALAGVLYGLLEKDPNRRWDVPTARAVLRDLLNGALVSSTPAHETDPYAVVRPAPWTPPTAPPSGQQIGGRAMLAPGETLSTALQRLRGAGGGKGPATPKPLDRTDPGLRAVGRDVPNMEPVLIQPGRRPGPPPVTAAPPAARRAAQHARPGASGAALSSVREVSVRALDELKRAPKAVRIGLVAGVSAAVLVIGVVGVVALAGGRGTPATASATPSASAAGPLIPVQEYHDTDLNVTVNVPQGWTKSTNGSYVDFTDPQDKSRRLRINTEKAGGTAQQFLGVAERGLKDPAKKTCTSPYARIDLRDVELAKHPAGELEYTCGQGDQMRHAIWRATVLDGRAYSFFVTVPASRFTESTAIYQEMVRSFRIDT